MAVYTFARQVFLFVWDTEAVDEILWKDLSLVCFEHLEDFDDLHLFWIRSVHFILPDYGFVRTAESIVDFLLFFADLLI